MPGTAGWRVSVLVPLLAVFALFNLVPVFDLVRLSLQRWVDVSAGRRSRSRTTRGCSATRRFWKVNTVLFTAVRVPLGLVIGLGIALCIRRTRLFRAFACPPGSRRP